MVIKNIFNCKTNATSLWFKHVIKNDLNYVQKNILEFKRTYQYQSNENKDKNNAPMFPGWAAIHIAAYLHYYEMFQFLFEYEFDLMTDNEVTVDCNEINDGLTIMSGSTIIHILIIANNPQMMEWVLKRMETSDECKQLAGIKNDSGYAALLYGAILGNSAAEKWLCNILVLTREIKCQNVKDQSIIHLIAYAGNRKYAQLLYGMITQKGPIYLPDDFVQQMKGILKCFFERQDKDHFTWLDLLQNSTPYRSLNNQVQHDQCRIEMVNLYESLQ